MAALLSLACAQACGSGKTGPSGGMGAGGGGVAGAGGAGPGAGGTPLGSGGARLGGGGAQAGVGGSSGVGTGGAAGAASGGVAGAATGSIGAGGFASGGVGTAGAGGGGLGGKASGGMLAPTAGAGGSLDADIKDAGPSDASPGCAQLDSTACTARKDCYPVFKRDPACTCATGCTCMAFDHCSDGAAADCTSPAMCNAIAPLCEDYYAPVIKNGCYEGCARQLNCAVPACPAKPPADRAACGAVQYPCFYEDCAGQGRTLAMCAKGVWTVQTAACDSFTCQGVGVTPAEITCSAGQVCVRTNLSNVVSKVRPTCVDNGCGASPVSPACLAGLSGTCSLRVTGTSAEIYCMMPPPCQGAGGCDYSYP